jgi:hypothetical protein
MDFPEPLSGMLRDYNWITYLETAQQIPIQNVERHTTPYLITNESGTIKVVGFIGGYINLSTRSINKDVFMLNFVIEENGKISHNTPSQIDNVIIYLLPENIHNEMLLANTILNNVFNINNLKKQNQIITDIRHLAQLNKTDYLKIKLHFHFRENPLMIAMSQQNLRVFRELIKHYNLDDFNYKNPYEQTILDQAYNSNLPAFVKIIKDAIKEKEFETYLYAVDQTGKKLPAVIVYDLSEYFIDNKKGGKKSKQRRNKKRNTRKQK